MSGLLIRRQSAARTVSRSQVVARALMALVAGHPVAPAEGDPVVIDGTTFRVWLRTSLQHRFASVRLEDLGWDAEAGEWRPVVPA